MYGYFFGMSVLWWFFWIVVIAVFFWLLVPVPRNRVRSTRDTPLDVLQRRYAAGEITTAEYEERRQRLLADRPDVGRPPEHAPPPPSPPPMETGPPPPDRGEHAHH